MRYGPDDTFWVVVDPTPESQIEDVIFECSLRNLELQFKGGLSLNRNPTLFTDEAEARREAQARMSAMQTFREILHQVTGKAKFQAVILDLKGNVLYRADFDQTGERGSSPQKN